MTTTNTTRTILELRDKILAGELADDDAWLVLITLSRQLVRESGELAELQLLALAGLEAQIVELVELEEASK